MKKKEIICCSSYKKYYVNALIGLNVRKPDVAVCTCTACIRVSIYYFMTLLFAALTDQDWGLCLYTG